MKIVVYTCALNEQKFVNRWFESAKDADEWVVADTGSTDNTLAALDNLGAGVTAFPISVKPWRFDDAKNSVMHMLPPDADVLVHLDMDEILTPGWRDHIEAVWTPGTTRLRYLFVWNWVSPGHPDKVFYGDKISGRFTHRWRNPVHEVLVPTVPEVVATCDKVLIEHHPDDNKSRESYLDLLKLSIQEDPFNDRNAHYYARELFFRGLFQEAMPEFRRHLALPTARWPAERAASLRYMGKCSESLNDSSGAYNCYMFATLEDPTSREAYIDLASFLLRQEEWCGVIHFAMKASNIAADSYTYITERYAREEGPFDLTAVALFHLGQKSAALDFAKKALVFNPQDPRLQENVRVMS